MANLNNDPCALNIDELDHVVGGEIGKILTGPNVASTYKPGPNKDTGPGMIAFVIGFVIGAL